MRIMVLIHFNCEVVMVLREDKEVDEEEAEIQYITSCNDDFKRIIAAETNRASIIITDDYEGNIFLLPLIRTLARTSFHYICCALSGASCIACFSRKRHY